MLLVLPSDSLDYSVKGLWLSGRRSALVQIFIIIIVIIIIIIIIIITSSISRLLLSILQSTKGNRMR